MAAWIVRALAGAIGVGAIGGAIGAGAQDYPTQAVRIIVPSSPGEAADAVLRIVAPGMSRLLGQPVVVDNRPGGAASIGMDVVAKAAPDGYTVGMADASFATNPLLFPEKMPYDTEKDLQPVTLLAAVPFVLAIHPSIPARSVKAFMAFAHAKPGALKYASAGDGSAGQLAAELFKQLTKTDLVHVPATSGGAALRSVLSGESALFFSSIAPAIGHYRAGRVRLIGITSAARDPSLPDVPAVAESVPGYESIDWQGLVVPTNTPPWVVAKLQQTVATVLADAALKERFGALGAWPKGSTTEDFAAHLQAERKKWAPVIQAANIRVD